MDYDRFHTDTFTEATRERYTDTHLWKPWMSMIRLRLAQSITDVEQFLRRASLFPQLCWDIETISLNPNPQEIVGHSICYNGDEALYIPVRHIEGADYNLDADIIFEMILDAIKPPKILTVYNARFELAFLREAGVWRSTSFKDLHDVLLLRWLYNSDDKRKDLKTSAKTLCNLEMLEIREVPGVPRDRLKRGRIDFSYSHPNDATLYAAADVIMTMRVQDIVLPEVIRTGQEMIVEVEHRLIHTLLKMEKNAVTFDRSVLHQGEKDLLRWADVVASELFAVNGMPFNLASQPSVAKFLRKMNVPMELTETGRDATNAKTLELLAVQFPVVEKVLLWRSLMKEVGTYAQPLLSYTSSDRPYGVFNLVQHSTTTGRLSSRKGDAGDPRFLPMNAQSIPAASAYAPALCREVDNPPESMMTSKLYYGGSYNYKTAEEEEIEKRIITNRFQINFAELDAVDEEDGDEGFDPWVDSFMPS